MLLFQQRNIAKQRNIINIIISIFIQRREIALMEIGPRYPWLDQHSCFSKLTVELKECPEVPKLFDYILEYCHCIQIHKTYLKDWVHAQFQPVKTLGSFPHLKQTKHEFEDTTNEERADVGL